MDARRATLVAVFVCCLVTGTASFSGLTPVDGTAANGSVAARATAAATPVPSDPACPARASTTTGDTDPPTRPRIVGLYPNPTTDDDVGEYVVLETPPHTRLRNLTLTDGHTTARLPNATGSGRVAVSRAPNVTERLTDTPVVGLEANLQLADDGDDIRLRNATATIGSVSYDSAPTAEQWYRAATTGDGDAAAHGTKSDRASGRWWPRDATCLPVSSASVDDATVFVLPDAPGVSRETIRTADERLLLAGYTVTSDAITDELVAAAERGVDVSVLLEASPVGGTPVPTDDVIRTLEAGGVDVRVIDGEDARYRYHHPKYAVADDRVLVTTENWKPAGVGGESSRGWGVRLENEALAADLADVFRADFEGWDTVSGAAYRANASFVEDEQSIFSSSAPEFPTNHEPSTVPVESAELLIAPDNADRRMQELIGAADDELLIVQPSIAADVSLLEATVEAARRGVDVRILLGSTWYNAEENEQFVADLERLAKTDDLPLEVRLVEDTDRFEKIHAKGVVVDREVAIVGSANWNSEIKLGFQTRIHENSMRN
ncbi:phospholipase D-like domain-containing protein [Natrinema sp. 1APR25-10V2]|uniref:phospholipase D-like domain-containing protein n=1 Tax=Natrinema sp. 1APR25-10V2 TaxID=2951081 RepID=UPI0028772377|nr:phospholipase D-like domain-containing protein [Natrinema sp. 1APR25-10V2]MDS0474334.1 phospholipase D-like domain-containing protein [Natrinema sp. 1APR25-10V2]